ncbi:MAG TPA: rhodanese-like domain-containing protein [Tepidisphaeraceae bacterium]|jgi:predicted sulfurtransferase
MDRVVNVAAYQFAQLDNLVATRDELRALTLSRNLRGVILLSTEGVNLSLAGARDDVDTVLARVRAIPGVGAFPVKETYSDTQPFNRMLVKIKREIIAFGVPGIEPQTYTSARLPPHELKQWLDEGRPVTLLDTRNQFEVEAGTFKGAVSIGIDHFRDFPAAVERLPEEMKHRPVVTFCTGGIRCEKAAPYLEKAGFTEVYQLDGGILDYFKTCGGSHYDGDCFVFDQRGALTPDLNGSGKTFSR